MEGYFSRLVKQTGIKFKPDVAFRKVLHQQTPMSYKEGSEGNLVEIEEHKLIDPRESQTVKSIPENARKSSEQSIVVSQREDFQPELKMEGFFHKSSKELPIHGPDLNDQKEHVLETEGQKRMDLDRDIQYPLVREPLQDVIVGEKLLEKEETVKVDTANDEHAAQSDNLPTLVGEGVKKDSAFKPGSKPDRQVSRARTWQSYIKEVTEWVSGTPTNSNDIVNSEIEIDKTLGIEKVDPRTFKNVEPLSVSYPRRIELQNIDGPEVHDFHLSIGTISLNLEGPQKETQTVEFQRTRDEKKFESRNPTSRLNRYYVRTR